MTKDQWRNSEIWEKVHRNLEKFGMHTQYPHEILVRWVSVHPPRKGDKALDIGFGSGRNLEMIEKKGYDPYGIEVSQTSIKYAQGISKNFKLSLFEPPVLNFSDNTFSFVISLQALYYNLDLEKVIGEIWRVLKANAYVYISFYGKNHWWIKEHSRKISSTLIEWAPTHPAPTERGLKLRFFDTKQKYLNVFKPFSDISINKYTYDLYGHHYEYVFVIAKKGSGKEGSPDLKRTQAKVKSFYAKQ